MKVLIAVQDDIFGEAITDMVAKHSWPAATEFRFLTVIEYETYGEMLDTLYYCCDKARNTYAEKQANAKSLLQSYKERLEAEMPEAAVDQRILFGRPKDVILTEAETWQSDVIVMGSHARKGLSRFLMGSVANAVLSHAPCSVIIVRLPQQQQDEGTVAHAATKTPTSCGSCK